MRRGAVLVLLLVSLTACARLREWRAGPVPSPGAAAPPAPPVASPPIPEPAPAPPPAAAPAPPPIDPPPASPTLTASLPPAEVRRLRDDAERRIEESVRILRQLEGRSLGPRDRETFLLARSLVEQARKALGGEEYERAANLATKARTLAGDLARAR